MAIVMRSGAIIVIPVDFSTIKLNGLLWEREEEGFNLKSLIQFERHFELETGILANEAIAIHQEIKSLPALQEVAGRYSISSEYKVITNFARLHILPGLVIVDTLGKRKFVGEIINRGLQRNFAYEIMLDTKRIAADHRNQWGRDFSDRVGRVRKGKLYGDGVEQDPIFGPELNKSTTGRVGWYTTFFGSHDKVIVSPKGSVQVWAQPPIELFLKFLRTIIIPYKIPSLRQTNILPLP